MEIDCIFVNCCNAPLCPMLTREENIQQSWYPEMPVCQLKEGVPLWVKQQRKIFDQIKLKNRATVFDLFMLEAPLKVKGNVKGVVPIKGQCRICETIDWFMENQLPIPEELGQYYDRHLEVEVDEDEVTEDQTIH